MNRQAVMVIARLAADWLVECAYNVGDEIVGTES